MLIKCWASVAEGGPTLNQHSGDVSWCPNMLTLILLITTIVVFNLFYWSIKSLLLGMKCVFNSLSASLLLNIFLSFEVGIAHAIANFK